ncbi:MAG: hypothetical protein SVY10_05355, partial [Thermodesulfobacteriota bacterium]|nr:hypothetical protein [Thermodesulfobacteriota bacterium]
MVFEKLLYATDGTILSLNVLGKLLATEGLLIEEVVVLSQLPLEKLAESLSCFEMKFKLYPDEDPSTYRILEVADKESASFIVAEFQKKTGRIHPDSSARTLIKCASIPALIINQVEEDKEIFQHMVFATDWSFESEKAFDFLLKLKGIIGELEIVHIIRKKLTVRDMRKLNKKLSDTRTTCLNNKIDAEYHIYAGEISEEIIAA